MAIVAPGYLGALQVFNLVQATIHPVPQTRDGPDLDRLHSFSKIVAPGMRLGCIVAPKARLSQLTVVKQAVDLHTNQPLQAALLELLKNEAFDEYLANICNVDGQRYFALACSLRDQLSSEFIFEPVY